MVLPVLQPPPLAMAPLPGIRHSSSADRGRGRGKATEVVVLLTRRLLDVERAPPGWPFERVLSWSASPRLCYILWMTQNLRITGTISAADSNFTGSDFNVSAHDSETEDVSGGACYDSSESWDDSTALYNTCSHLMSSQDVATIDALEGTNYTVEQLGAVYDYAAATAGTIVGYYDEGDDYIKNYEEATEDICPAGWSMPYYNYNNYY